MLQRVSLLVLWGGLLLLLAPRACAQEKHAPASSDEPSRIQLAQAALDELRAHRSDVLADTSRVGLFPSHVKSGSLLAYAVNSSDTVNRADLPTHDEALLKRVARRPHLVFGTYDGFVDCSVTPEPSSAERIEEEADIYCVLRRGVQAAVEVTALGIEDDQAWADVQMRYLTDEDVTAGPTGELAMVGYALRMKQTAVGWTLAEIVAETGW